MAPKFTVVIPLYNKAQFVERAVCSVIAQNFVDWEMVVVDDGSTDGGIDVVNEFRHPQIRCVSQQNSGVSVARNRGIREASGDVLAFLDADDEWTQDHLGDLVGLSDRFPAAGVYGTGYSVRTSETAQRDAVINGIDPAVEQQLKDYFAVAARSEPPLCSSSVAMKKFAIEQIGGFPVGVGQGEDLLTWARLAVRYPVAYHPRRSAIIWQPLTLSGLPTRRPEHPDLVGAGLRDLLLNAPADLKRSIRRYIGLWHKMRGTMFLRLGDRAKARGELVQAMANSPFSIKLNVYVVLAVLPFGIGVNMSRWAALRRVS